jgi:hypothetical protein
MPSRTRDLRYILPDGCRLVVDERRVVSGGGELGAQQGEAPGDGLLVLGAGTTIEHGEDRRHRPVRVKGPASRLWRTP